MARTVRVCPNCGSTDIGHDSLSVISRLSLSGARECHSCGYAGIFPEADPDDIEGFDGADADVQSAAAPDTAFRPRRALSGGLLLLLGLAPVLYLSWGEGLLPGMLALAVGAAVLAEELSRRFRG